MNMFGRAPLTFCWRAEPRTKAGKSCSGAESRAWISRARVAYSRVAVAGLCLIGGTGSGCSLLFDSDRQQCADNSDCPALGFTGSVCSAGLCQASGTSMENVTPAQGDASSGAMLDAAIDASAPVSDAQSALDSSATEASIGASPQDASVSDASPDACSGASCPECTVHADCESRGFVGGICADMKCWAAQSECNAETDCSSKGVEFAGGRCFAGQCRPNPRWRCEPAPPTPVSGTKQLTLLVRDSLSLTPLPNIRGVICQKLDLTCSAPVGEAKTGADGKMTMTVPANLAGYLKVEEQNYQPAMYFLPAVFPADGVLQPFPLLSSGLIFDALALTLGATVDRTRGHLMLVAEDCLGAALPGVTFTSPQRDAATVQFYVRDLLPSTSAKETAEIGNGGFLNFPAGTAVLELKKLDLDLRLTTASVVVRAGYVSIAYIRPDRR
jgi:hypothetical protein